MGANNWRICPQCKKNAETARNTAITTAGAEYGKVDAAEYVRIVNEASKPIVMEETLREDYQIRTSTDGVFSVEYRASCDECGMVFDFDREETLKLK